MSLSPGGRIIVGVGSRLRTDDAAGLVALDEIARRGPPEGVRLVECAGDDIGLVEHLRSAGRVVVMDAAAMGEPPGTVRAFPAGLLDGAGPGGLDIHSFGVAGAIGLARALGAEPEVTLVGIEPGSTAPGEGLTPAVASRIGDLADAALAAARDG